MRWFSHPLVENKKRSVILFLFLCGIFYFTYLYYGLSWMFFVMLVLFLSLFSYFVPTEYIFTEQEIIIKGLLFERKFLWSHFKRYYVDNRGIFLSPFSNPTRLENFRGVYIRFGKGDRDAIIRFVKRKIDERSFATCEERSREDKS